LIEPARMVFTFRWDGDDGRPENEMLITITLAEEGTDNGRQWPWEPWKIGR
jgi:uncharacterized protein YndB with AHSA1/START domain